MTGELSTGYIIYPPAKMSLSGGKCKKRNQGKKLQILTPLIEKRRYLPIACVSITNIPYKTANFDCNGCAPLCDQPLSTAGLENDLLCLHLVKDLVPLNCLGKRHDFIRHESGKYRLAAVYQSSCQSRVNTYPRRCCFFLNISRASGKTDRTGHLPI